MNAELRVGGLVPLTTLDYPGRLACVLFCQGCAWRCRYCHNPQLIPPGDPGTHPWAAILDFLHRRQGMLEAVVFSGGEPTLQRGLVDAMVAVRELGFKVGLHSAGIRPRSFQNALKYADWVGFDVKALREDSEMVTGVAGSGGANWRSLEYLLASEVDYECRTTVHWQLFTADSLLHLARSLRMHGVQRYVVQIARTEGVYDNDLPLVNMPPPNEAALWAEIATLFPQFEVRKTGGNETYCQGAKLA